jgi:hypothetical protein
LLLVSVISGFLLAGASVVAQAQDAAAPAAHPSLWSDTATWPNHKVPVADDKPTIGKDKDVTG